jgi:hypothetical protein
MSKELVSDQHMVITKTGSALTVEFLGDRISQLADGYKIELEKRQPITLTKQEFWSLLSGSPNPRQPVQLILFQLAVPLTSRRR